MKHQDQYMDIYSSMLAKGIIFVNAKIDQRIAGLITTCLLYINETASIVQPKIYLNTNQGDVVSAMSVVDVMQYLKDNTKHKVNIETFGFGEIGIAAALILTAGTKGFRNVASHSQLGLYLGIESLEFSTIQGTEAKAKQQEKMREKVVELFTQFSGLDAMLIMAHLNKQDYFDANEAQEKGYIDGII
ncbi:MAG: ATP-dependent Clp protease proteolytic subunit [Candidatus Hodarchaeota archaeon]